MFCCLLIVLGLDVIAQQFSRLASRIHCEVSCSEEDYNTVVQTSATERISAELQFEIEVT